MAPTLRPLLTASLATLLLVLQGYQGAPAAPISGNAGRPEGAAAGGGGERRQQQRPRSGGTRARAVGCDPSADGDNGCADRHLVADPFGIISEVAGSLVSLLGEPNDDPYLPVSSEPFFGPPLHPLGSSRLSEARRRPFAGIPEVLETRPLTSRGQEAATPTPGGAAVGPDASAVRPTAHGESGGGGLVATLADEPGAVAPSGGFPSPVPLPVGHLPQQGGPGALPGGLWFDDPADFHFATLSFTGAADDGGEATTEAAGGRTADAAPVQPSGGDGGGTAGTTAAPIPSSRTVIVDKVDAVTV